MSAAARLTPPSVTPARSDRGTAALESTAEAGPRIGPARPGVNLSARLTLRRAARVPVLLTIRFYQRVISPWTAPSCRYYPSCSQYAAVAVERFGVARGGWLALRRLGRCHPWAAGGVDHVPAAGPGAATPVQGA